jgi:hypothetical protein
MNPSDAPDIYYYIFMARAQANIKLRNYKEAITDCNWAIFLRRDQAEPYYYRALASINKREFNNVCDDLTKSAQLGQPDIQKLQKRYCQNQVSTAISQK